ncbi:MAG TPA: hypothetical protein VGI12_18300 [Vicinamibacterales bacterium]|jgi:hypothetical protein
MRQLSITPSVTVTIGRHTRQYFAFVTTAPAELDTPATVTLHTGPFADLAGFVADPFIHDVTQTSGPARLVLVDAMELAWQRAKYRGQQHHLLRADPGLVALNTLQHWLWQRLKGAALSAVTA